MNFIKRLYERLKIITMWTLACTGSILLIFLICQAVIFYKNTHIYDLRKIIVNNERILNEAQVIKLSGLKKGVRIMDIEREKTANRLNESPYIVSSKITLHYPASVEVEIQETQPIAFIKKDNVLNYVDSEGQLIGKAKPENSYDLPVINSQPDTEVIEFLNLAFNLSPLTYHKISEIEKTGTGIELYLNESSTRVIVGENDFDKKIVVLENFLKEEYDSIPFGRVDYIDLRFDKQVILKEYRLAEK